MSTQQIIQSIYSSLGLSKKLNAQDSENKKFYREIANKEIDKIILEQKRNSQANRKYAASGCAPMSVTAKIVQNQIARASYEY